MSEASSDIFHQPTDQWFYGTPAGRSDPLGREAIVTALAEQLDTYDSEKLGVIRRGEKQWRT